jgi:transitional endoplasmic reticulum ATPase
MKSWGATPTAGIIFYGPPGTGKTLLAMVIATEVNAEVYNIKMTDIATNEYINTGANSIKELFNFIRTKAQQNPQKHIIIILDEMDALLQKRNNKDQGGEDKKIVNTFLSEMSGFDTKSNVMFIGTTNNYDSLDSAVVRSGRFSTKVKVDLPDQEGRTEAFRIHIEKARKRAQRKDIFTENIDLSVLAQASDGLSPADIEESIKSIVRKRAVKESDDTMNEEFKTPISMEELIGSIQHLKTSNGKTNQLLKSFSPEELQKLPADQQAYVRDAIHQILLESHIKELRGAVQSGKINADALQ